MMITMVLVIIGEMCVCVCVCVYSVKGKLR